MAPKSDAVGKTYTRHGGFVAQAGGFDAEFFGITPREAASMDPQQRMLLEVTWEALEHAGIPTDSLSGSRTGVMMGVYFNEYQSMVASSPDRVDAYTGTGSSHSITAGRISYLLGLRGPAAAVDTACSSSLSAIHLACQSLRARETDLALAGGVSVTLRRGTRLIDIAVEDRNPELGRQLADSSLAMSRTWTSGRQGVPSDITLTTPAA